MKKLHVFVAGLGLLMLAAPVSSFAGKKSQTPPPPAKSDVYAKYDTNSDGVLSTNEVAAIRADFTKDPMGPLAVYDTNKDGKLSDDEIAAIPATKQADAPHKKHKKKQ